MQYLNEKRLKAKIAKLTHPGAVKYWRSWAERYAYMKLVVEQLRIIQPTTVLEMGAYAVNLTSVSDNLDRDATIIDPDNRQNRQYVQDAQHIPWPIADKHYDVFVSLQVWEHLDGHQSAVFDEVKRVSRRAILSFPYLWDKPKNKVHHNIGDSIIRQWVNDHRPYRIDIVGSDHKRAIWYFDFEGE